MTLTIIDLLQLLQRAVDEGHGDCRVEARNISGDFDYLDARSVQVVQHSGEFILRLDPT